MPYLGAFEASHCTCTYFHFSKMYKLLIWLLYTVLIITQSMISFMCEHDLQLVGTLNQYKFNKGSSSLFNFPGEVYHLTALQTHPLIKFAIWQTEMIIGWPFITFL